METGAQSGQAMQSLLGQASEIKLGDVRGQSGHLFEGHPVMHNEFNGHETG